MSNPHITSVTQLELKYFRNQKFFEFKSLPATPIILTGPNGAGKTSILEAISLLTLSKGLRGAKIADLANRDISASCWSITGNIYTIYGLKEISTYLNVRPNSKTDTRSIQIDGKVVKKKEDLNELIRTVWLTPSMQQIFINPSSERRVFFDLIVSNFFPNHVTHITKYEKSMRERLKLLKNQCKDEYWLSSLENAMFEEAQKISSARMETINMLSKAIEANDSPFQKASLKLINEPLDSKFLELQKYNRRQDFISGRTNLGPHLYDMEVFLKDRDIPAKLCSTGEQKALLLNIVLAHVKALITKFNVVPILLFDEIISHLDGENRVLLFEELLKLKSQVWLTGIEKKSFSYIENSSKFISLYELQ